MIIKTLKIGDFSVNNYIIIDEESHDAVIIDAGGDFEAVKKVLDENKATLKAVLQTHAHLDHIAGTKVLQDKFGAKVYLHKDDEFWIDNLEQQIQMLGLSTDGKPKVDEYVEDGQELNFGNLKFKVIHTKGHSKGSVSFLIDDILFSGDTLFAQSVGRTDLPGGDFDEIENSISNILFKLDENIIVYPGHGWDTTIGKEKATNPFFGEQSRVC